MKLACIKVEPKYWDRKAYAKYRHRSDAAERKGNGTSEGEQGTWKFGNTFRT